MKAKKIFVTGHRGLLGSALVRRLTESGYTNLLLRSRSELDLTNQAAVNQLLTLEKPDYIFHIAAKAGGIDANNNFRAQFIYENLMMEANVIHGAWKAGIQRLLFIGSNCSYPQNANLPIRENSLLTGPLEPNIEPYAIAKIAGIKLCENYNRSYGTQYLTAMATNLYGPNDNYDLNNSHVLPALIRKAHEAKEQDRSEFIVWGSGKAYREFLYVDDMADACIFLMENQQREGIFNVGTGSDISVHNLAKIIAEIVGFKGQIIFDPSKPDGSLRKVFDVSRLNKLGWQAKMPLREGIKKTYETYLNLTQCKV